VTYKAQLF